MLSVAQHHDISSLRYIYHYKIADAVPLEVQVTFADIATHANVNENQVKRMLRHAMTNNLFCEPKVGYVAHTAGSRLLLHGGTKDWVGYCVEETFPATAKLVDAIDKYGATMELHESAWNLANNTELPIFKYLEGHPERAQRFARTMTALTTTDGYHIRHLINGYDWRALGKATVVDVGGSSGHVSIGIAEVATELEFVVQDLPNIVAKVEEALPANLKDRISFQAHDFFTPQPVTADVYLVRFILHDYSDLYAIRILKCLVPAMRPGSRLIVTDGILPPPNTMPPSEERLIRIMDLEMMTSFNAKEREIEDWTSLFAQADPRLKLHNVIKPPGSVNSIFEFVFDQDAQIV